MKIKSETELNKLLKEGGPKGLYFLWGTEGFLIESWQKKITASFEDGGSFNYTQLEGQGLDLNLLFDATQQLPLLAPSKCVVVKDFDTKAVVGEELEKLEEILTNLPEETVLVISCRAAGLDARSAGGKKILAFADKYGVAAEFGPRDSGGLTRFLQSAAKKNGSSISPQLAKEMVRLCGNEMLVLTSEMEKLSAYVGGREITIEDIEKIVTPKVEERIFDLSKAILGGNPQRAMEIVSGLLYMRENPIAIVATLIMSYADLYRARAAKDQGENTDKVAELFEYRGREFRIRNAFGVRISRKALASSLDALYRCENQMKSTGLDSSVILEQTVMELISVREQDS